MRPAALALILGAAVIHASWNLIAKRAGGGVAFAWCFSVVETTLYLPAAVVALVILEPEIGLEALGLIAASAALHAAYFLSLQRGYRVGDLGLVYPIARGLAPLLAMAGAVVFLGERPGPATVAGALLVAGGVLSLAAWRTDARAGAAYALLTAVLIAAYTVVDGRAVGGLRVPPIVLIPLVTLGRLAILTPLALRRRSALAAVWREHRGAAIGVGVLGPLAYLLVLSALAFTPVSPIAAAREISILVAVVLGARALAERDTIRRAAAAVAIVAGVVTLSLG